VDERVTKGIIVVQHALATMKERARHAQSGQALVEYILILAIIALGVVVAMKVLQPAISHTLNQTACTLNSAGMATPTAAATPCS
jgi:Flp pilus assembly pilin Flp